jgi:hypothetical protein
MLRRLLAGSLALSAAPAAAEDWWYVGMTGDPGGQYAAYADRESRSRTGDSVTVREASEYERVSARGIVSGRFRTVYDCRARTAQIVDAVFYGPDGRERERSAGDPAPHGIEPGSVYEMKMQFACGETEGLERLGRLRIREQALLLFRDRTNYLAAHPTKR